MAGNKGITRDDLTSTITQMGELMEEKIGRVSDKIDAVQKTLVAHAEAFTKTTEKVDARITSELERVDSVHEGIFRDVNSLKKHRWQMIGAITTLGAMGELILHFLFPKAK